MLKSRLWSEARRKLKCETLSERAHANQLHEGAKFAATILDSMARGRRWRKTKKDLAYAGETSNTNECFLFCRGRQLCGGRHRDDEAACVSRESGRVHWVYSLGGFVSRQRRR